MWMGYDEGVHVGRRGTEATVHGSLPWHCTYPLIISHNPNKSLITATRNRFSSSSTEHRASELHSCMHAHAQQTKAMHAHTLCLVVPKQGLLTPPKEFWVPWGTKKKETKAFGVSCVSPSKPVPEGPGGWHH